MISAWSRIQLSFFPKLLLLWFCFLNTLRKLSHRFSEPGQILDWPQTGWTQAGGSLPSARLRARGFLTVSSGGLGWSLAHRWTELGEERWQIRDPNSVLPPQNEGVHWLKCDGLLLLKQAFKLNSHYTELCEGTIALFSVDLIFFKNLLSS